MSKFWNATMPRSAPAEGKAHVVVAVKSSIRSELVGQLPADQAIAVLHLAQASPERFLKLKAAMDTVPFDVTQPQGEQS